jgi:glycosyltransferase involved in cell wall biosynthesis
MASETASPTVSVVVPTAGRTRWLAAIAQAVLEDGALEVVIVDDRPFEARAAPIELPGDEARVRVAAGPRTGPGAARQAGAEAARGDVLLLLDDDVLPAPGLVAGHAARHAEEAGLVVAGAMPVDLGPGEPRPRFPRALYAADYLRRTERWRADPGDVLEHLWTGNVSLRRADALRVGLAAPDYRGYRHEDRELGLRLRAAGLRGAYAPDLRAAHRYERAPEAFFADARAQGAEQALLARLHPAADVPRGVADLLTGVPAPLRPLLALAARRRGAAVLRAGLAAALAAAGALRADVAALRLAQLRRRVEQVDGWMRPGVGQ